MRDTKRIDDMIEQIRMIWKRNPDLRLGQLIGNCCNEDYIYWVEDDDLSAYLGSFYHDGVKGEDHVR